MPPGCEQRGTIPRMKIALGTLAMVLVAACSSGASQSPTARASSASPTPAVSARQRWDQIRAELGRASSGHIRSETTPEGKDVPLITEDGAFDLTHGSLDLQIDTLTGDGPESTRVRVAQNGAGYLQQDSWKGAWSGCWLPRSARSLEQDSNANPGDKAMPLPLRVVLAAKIRTRGPVPDGHQISASIDAYSALRVLGFSGSGVESLRSMIQRVTVPLVLMVWDDPLVIEGDVHGKDAVQALAAAGQPLPSRSVRLVRERRTHLRMISFGRPVTIAAPDAALLLPPGAGKNVACPANR
jgi:hypothetical protein